MRHASFLPAQGDGAAVLQDGEAGHRSGRCMVDQAAGPLLGVAGLLCREQATGREYGQAREKGKSGDGTLEHGSAILNRGRRLWNDR